MIHAFLFASAAGAPSQVADVSDLTTPLDTTEPTASGDRPQVSIQFNTNGDIEEATGSTGAALSYSTVGTWLADGVDPLDSSDWEVQVTVDTEDVGDPGTWTGAATGSYLALSTTRTWTWTKDGTDLGTAESEVTVTLRRVSDTGNTDNKTVTCQVTISA